MRHFTDGLMWASEDTVILSFLEQIIKSSLRHNEEHVNQTFSPNSPQSVLDGSSLSTVLALRRERRQ